MIYLGLAPVSQKGLQLHTGLAKPPHLYIQVCGGGTGTYFPGGTNSHKSRGYARIVKVFEVVLTRQVPEPGDWARERWKQVSTIQEPLDIGNLPKSSIFYPKDECTVGSKINDK